MCPPKTKTPPPPAPPPAAPPPPSETAGGISAPTNGTSNTPGNRTRRGIEALRVDLNVPGGRGNGVNIPS